MAIQEGWKYQRTSREPRLIYLWKNADAIYHYRLQAVNFESQGAWRIAKPLLSTRSLDSTNHFVTADDCDTDPSSLDRLRSSCIVLSLPIFLLYGLNIHDPAMCLKAACKATPSLRAGISFLDLLGMIRSRWKETYFRDLTTGEYCNGWLFFLITLLTITKVKKSNGKQMLWLTSRLCPTLPICPNPNCVLTVTFRSFP